MNTHAALPAETYRITTLATELNAPWSMLQLADGSWLITERDGHVVIAKAGRQKRVKLALDTLYVAGQGGLLDIVLSAEKHGSASLIFTYAQGSAKANRLVVSKATYDGANFSQPEIIYRVAPDKSTPQHYAGRALLLPDNTLLLTSGDGFDYREQAQVLHSQLGKILRIHPDGRIPDDNPFRQHSSATAQAVYSLGHRNPQGLVYDYDAGQIISHEHGPAGGDELNLIRPGLNYGWPVITYGRDYSGARISPFREYPGMQLPSVNWTPSIAPSGMAYYGSRHRAFASLHKHLLVSTLVDRKLYAINLRNGRFEQSPLFPEITGRLRNVGLTPEGHIAVLTDGKGGQLMLIEAQGTE